MVKHKAGLVYQNDNQRVTKRYATKERMTKVNPENIKIYEKYLRSRGIQNKEVRNTTYKVYHSYMNIFMCFIAERWDNFYLLDEDFIEEEMLDVMEDYMSFLQDECGNGKKVINTKLSAVSSFYLWAVKRRMIKMHPFDGRLERMKDAISEKKIAAHFLTAEQCEQIRQTLAQPKSSLNRYDLQDEVLWNIAFDSAARIGALSKLTISSLDLEKNLFKNIREKRAKYVEVPFTPHTRRVIDKYLEWRKEVGVDCDALFVSYVHGEWRGMSTQSLTNRVRKIGEIIGIGDFRPHSIRKTRLNMIAEKDLNLAKAMAHHESADTTSRFYTKPKSEAETLSAVTALMQEDEENTEE